MSEINMASRLLAQDFLSVSDLQMLKLCQLLLTEKVAIKMRGRALRDILIPGPGVRNGFRERGAILVFGAPHKCDLLGRLSEKRESMPFLCVVPPQKSIFCCASFWFYNCVRSSTEIKAFPTFF